MDFRLLGPIEAGDGEELLDLGPPKQRALLALLLLDAGRAQPSDRLIDGLWGERAPDSARKMVQVYVSQLRKVLAPDTLRTHAAGYAIEITDDALDVTRFERLARDGRRALDDGDPGAAAERLRAALGLWRGPALAELDEPFARAERDRLEHLRLTVLEDRVEADLALGRHGDLPAELEPLVQRHPERERLRAQHMLALYRCGRQAEALASYRDAWRVLGEQLGIQPSEQLRALEQRILRQDPDLAGPLRSAPARPPSPVPHPDAVTRYAANGDLSLAYQVFGRGERELLLVTGWVLPMELAWDDPGYAAFLARLGERFRVLLWDKRGTGLSDRLPPGELPSVEERMTDLTAVMDAAGFERPDVLGLSEGAVLACVLAASHPERTRSLTLYGGWARTIAHDDYPWGATAEQHQRLVGLVREHWGDAARLLRYWAPDSQHDAQLRAWWARALRLGASPTAAVQWLRMMADFDIRSVLPSIRVPALVLHRVGDVIVPAGNGRYLARRIPGAEYVELPGADHLWWRGDRDALLDAVERFLDATPRPAIPDTVLATLVRIELPRDGAREADGKADGALLAELERQRGRVVAADGRTVVAAFDGPTRAVRCAAAIRDELAAGGAGVRVGVHAGECELVGDGLRGTAVDVVARIAALAAPGEILVSRTVTELVAGSGLRFRARDERAPADERGPIALLALAGG